MGTNKKIRSFWTELKPYQKALLSVGIILLSLIVPFALWLFSDFQLNIKLFLSAAFLLILNVAAFVLLVWKKRKFQTVLMGLISLILVAVIVFSVFFWTFAIKKIYNYDSNFPESEEELSALPIINKKVTNIALFGIDTRNMESFSGNSDAIMVLSIDVKNHTVKIISIMRDTLVPIERNGQTIYAKINSAYARGGAALAVRTINMLFNLDITDYATVNFYGLAKIIDVVGGIEVELTEEEASIVNKMNGDIPLYNDSAETNTQPQIMGAGKYTLNGYQAVSYARIRKLENVWGTNNDYGRTDRQRYVMEQMFNKALTINSSKYPELIKAVLPYTVTSLSPDEILDFALSMIPQKPTFQQARMPQNEYLMHAPSGSFGSVVYYDLDFAATLIHEFLYNNTTFQEYTDAHGILKNDWYAARYNTH